MTRMEGETPCLRAVLGSGFLATLILTSSASATTAGGRGGCGETVPERILTADPSTYRTVLTTLQPGDLLQLADGDYTEGLPLADLHGEEDRCIVIEGPATGPTARFTVRTCCNTVSLGTTSYLVLRNLEIDGTGDTVSADGVKLESTAAWSHHVTLENLWIHDHDYSQQTVCISTKAPAWNWVLRTSLLERCGTGVYFGNSDGEEEFVNGLVEYNLIRDTTGYNLQIKHQNGRATGLGSPATGITILRHNVLSRDSASPSDPFPRPNLLVGHWPLAGDGSDDDYLIYGNLFYENGNGVEALFQGEGNVILYDNLFVNRSGGPAVAIQPHNDVPKRIRVFQNTVLSSGTGISVSGGDPAFDQLVTGNAAFAETPLSGGTQTDNVTDGFVNAGNYLTRPSGTPTGDSSGLDLHPLDDGSLDGPVDSTGITGWEDADRDFNHRERIVSRRGAYGTAGENPGWLLALERKPLPGIFADGFESGSTDAWSLVVP